MAEPIEISTGTYKKEGKVSVDGHIWTVKLPGAATELKLNQAQRRLTALHKKVENETITEPELDRYDEYEATLYGIMRSMFQDGTEDNSEVNKWIDETPMAIIVMALEDIKSQANGTKEAEPQSS